MFQSSKLGLIGLFVLVVIVTVAFIVYAGVIISQYDAAKKADQPKDDIPANAPRLAVSTSKYTPEFAHYVLFGDSWGVVTTLLPFWLVALAVLILTGPLIHSLLGIPSKYKLSFLRQFTNTVTGSLPKEISFLW